MNAETFEAFLYEDEGNTLDFKRDQYKFAGATDDEKSELIKDILAFANAWRRTDAYILIGVEEVKDGRSRAVGIAEHLSDSSVQQLVNSKTQRPVEFSYSTINFENQQIGIIRITVQERPIYLKKHYGKLRKGVVYVRQSSATAEAEPDEIARMGKAKQLASEAPCLKLELADADQRIQLGTTAVLRTILFDMPPVDQIPDDRTDAGFTMIMSANADYYRELATYVRDFGKLKPIRLAVTNTGNSTARGVRVEVDLSDPESEIFAVDECDLPSEPQRSSLIQVPFTPSSAMNDVTVERVPHAWRIVSDFGKCQPQQTIVTGSKLYLGATTSRDVQLDARVFSDELTQPIEVSLGVSLEVEQRSISVEQLLNS